MANHLHMGDLPDDLDLGPVVAIDCETMGLNPHRDGCAWCRFPPGMAMPT